MPARQSLALPTERDKRADAAAVSTKPFGLELMAERLKALSPAEGRGVSTKEGEQVSASGTRE